MIRSLLCAGLLALIPNFSIAQDAAFDASPTENCLVEATDLNAKRICVGKAAEACADAAIGGFNTRNMTGCLGLEHAWFDALLNVEYGKTRDLAIVFDEHTGGALEGDPMVDVLRDMQRAWIAYRDSTCRFEERQFAGGTLGELTYADCMTRLTAEQAFLLQSNVLGL